MDSGYDNPITIKDELLVRFAFSSCCIYAYSNQNIPLKNALKIHKVHDMEGNGYKLPKKDIDIVANSTFQCWIIILFGNFNLEKKKLHIF